MHHARSGVSPAISCRCRSTSSPQVRDSNGSAWDIRCSLTMQPSEHGHRGNAASSDRRFIVHPPINQCQLRRRRTALSARPSSPSAPACEVRFHSTTRMTGNRGAASTVDHSSFLVKRSTLFSLSTCEIVAFITGNAKHCTVNELRTTLVAIITLPLASQLPKNVRARVHLGYRNARLRSSDNPHALAILHNVLPSPQTASRLPTISMASPPAMMSATKKLR